LIRLKLARIQSVIGVV